MQGPGSAHKRPTHPWLTPRTPPFDVISSAFRDDLLRVKEVTPGINRLPDGTDMSVIRCDVCGGVWVRHKPERGAASDDKCRGAARRGVSRSCGVPRCLPLLQQHSE